MKRQPGEKEAFKVNSLFQLVVDGVVSNWEDETEYDVEIAIGNVLQNATKSPYRD